MRRFVLYNKGETLIEMLKEVNTLLSVAEPFWWRVRRLWASGAENYLGSGMADLEQRSREQCGLVVSSATMRAFLCSHGQVYEGVFEAWSDASLTTLIARIDGMDQTMLDIESNVDWFAVALGQRGVAEVVSFE